MVELLSSRVQPLENLCTKINGIRLLRHNICHQSNRRYLCTLKAFSQQRR